MVQRPCAVASLSHDIGHHRSMTRALSVSFFDFPSLASMCLCDRSHRYHVQDLIYAMFKVAIPGWSWTSVAAMRGDDLQVHRIGAMIYNLPWRKSGHYAQAGAVTLCVVLG